MQSFCSSLTGLLIVLLKVKILISLFKSIYPFKMSKQKDSTVSKKILDYLIDQNRPFSANDILNSLQIDCSKTVMTKALDSLVAEKNVKEKIYGKQKVFYVNQNVFNESKNEDLQIMDGQINELSNTIAAFQKQILSAEDILRGLDNSLTTEMARTELKAAKMEIDELKKKLESVESKTAHLDPKEMKTLIAKKELYAKQYQRRKRIANNVIDSILEGYPKTKKQLLEELGVESDGDRLL